ncbi:DivIVA [Rubrobacter xylanophilus DSM 9941]|uniref:Cell wall synthesis protein Wag31 n=1 Tax=Rubrobacter xylanophilus (strain DSM 9941 / JCM 11954 / NBRC 16129 / PRD-1) TaxID=266117 RepID=Q1AVY3_RUBXD|nr:DivIVA domain-containing protein [Rubrobacter xylanophilus]ABG04445.1 DivIVA [Rubrobacter xylanophilus DSM 9941]
MAIRPIDVRRKEFKSVFRGYDANQVDDFLDAVADEFERAYTENQRMREEISGLRERLQQFEELEESIRAALVHAEQAANDLRESARREAENLRESARREAELTIREAKTRSHQMLADSSGRVERVQESYEALQEAKRKFANDFRHLLKTYMEMLDSLEISTAREIESSLRERLDTESVAVAREAARSEQEAPAEGAGVAAEETQKIEPEQLPASPEAPEAEEPEVEPSSSAGGEDEARAAAEQAAEEAPERGPLAEETSEQEFFERQPAPEERREDNRIFRASRFLRRRG